MSHSEEEIDSLLEAVDSLIEENESLKLELQDHLNTIDKLQSLLEEKDMIINYFDRHVSDAMNTLSKITTL